MAFAPQPKFQAFDDSGFPLSGGHLKTFIAGSSTPIETYTDESLSVANPVNITLNSRGEADVHLKTDTTYKFELLTANNVVIWTVDNITAGTGGSGGSVSWADITGKPTTFTPSPHNQAFSTITSKPTSISGYGITDAYTKTEVDSKDTIIQGQVTANTNDILVTNANVAAISAQNIINSEDIVDLVAKDVNLQNQININTSAIDVLQSNDEQLFIDVNNLYNLVANPVFDTIVLTTSATPTVTEGQIAWNNVDKTVNIGMANGVTQQVGEEFFIHAHNETGSTILNGTAVYLTSATVPDGSLHVSVASKDSNSGQSVIALATQDVLDGEIGYFTKYGQVRDLNTSGLAEGNKVYLGLNGSFTSAQAVYPDRSTVLGYCVNSHATSGSIYVSVSSEEAVEDLYNVTITNPTMGDSFVYENNQWINRNFGSITKDPTGFASPELITVTYDESTRKVTLGGTVSAFYRANSVPMLSAGYISPAHSAGVSSTQFLYYNGTDIVFNSTPWSFSDIQIAAVVYAPNGQYIATIKETHGTMAWQTHREFHDTIGCYLGSGGDLSSYTLAAQITSARRPDVSLTILNDEDLQTTLPALTTKTYTQFSLSSTNTMNFTSASTDIVALNVNIPYYNQFTGGNWVQTPFGNNEYGAVFVFAMPAASDVKSQAKRYVFVQPQTVSTTLSVIQNLTPNNVNLNGLAALNPELCFIGKIIIQYASGGSNWLLTSVEKLVGTKVSQTAVVGSYLSLVTTDTSLSGNGTNASPLGLAITPFTKTSADTLYAPITSLNNYVATSGDEMTGDLWINKVTTPTLTIGAVSATQSTVTIQGTSGSEKRILLGTGTTARWGIISTNTAESSANAGSDLALRAYNQAGSLIDSPITIARAAGGNISLNRNVTVSGLITAIGANGGLYTDSTDSTDNKTNTISSTDAQSSARGGYIVVKGNEVATNGGDIVIVAGNSGTGSGTLRMYTGGLEKINITKEGTFNFTVPAGQGINATVPNVTDLTWNAVVSGDTYGRTTIYPGKIEFGAGGTSARDTNLYRSNPNELKTDDNLVIVGAVYPQAGIYVKPATGNFVDTVSGSDTSYNNLCGGGGQSMDRGGYIQVIGNNYPSVGGSVAIIAGNPTSGNSDIVMYTGAQVERLRITKAGSIVASSPISGTTLDLTTDLMVGDLGYIDTGVLGAFSSSAATYNQVVVRNKQAGATASSDFIVNNNLSTSAATYGDFGINSSTFTGTPKLNQPNATYLYAAGGNLVLGTSTDNGIDFVVNNGTANAITITSAGVITNTGAVTNSSTTTMTGAVTASSTVVANGIVTVNNTLTARAVATTTQAFTAVAAGTQAWALSAGNTSTIVLTAVTAASCAITTSAPTAGAFSFLTVIGHGSASRVITVAQSGVQFTFNGVITTAGGTCTLNTVGINKRVTYQLYWVNTTQCFISLVALDEEPSLPTKMSAARIWRGETAYSTSTNISSPETGRLYALSGSSQTYDIGSTGLTVGDMFYVAVNNGCPSSTVTYTDYWGAATSLAMTASTKYYYTFYRSGGGFSVFGGSV